MGRLPVVGILEDYRMCWRSCAGDLTSRSWSGVTRIYFSASRHDRFMARFLDLYETVVSHTS
jgi:hypothetical protein